MKVLLFSAEFDALLSALCDWFNVSSDQYKDYDGSSRCPEPNELFLCSCLIVLMKDILKTTKPFDLDGESFYRLPVTKSDIDFIISNIIDDVVSLDNQVSILKAFNRALLYE